jgi:hypothetical protein
MEFRDRIRKLDRKVYLVLAALALLLLALVVFSDDALAAPVKPDAGGGGNANAKAAGENIQALIQGIAAPICFSLAGLTSLVALVRRDIGIAFAAFATTLFVGVFVVPGGPEALEGFSKTLAKALDR